MEDGLGYVSRTPTPEHDAEDKKKNDAMNAYTTRYVPPEVIGAVLGHASLAMTMKYAHFSPGHLAEVVNLNPLAVRCGHSVDDTADVKSETAKA